MLLYTGHCETVNISYKTLAGGCYFTPTDWVNNDDPWLGDFEVLYLTGTWPSLVSVTALYK